MNNLYQQMNTRNLLSNGNIQQMATMMKTMKNPQAMLNQLAQSNPQVKDLMTMLQSSGKSPKDLFYQVAQEKGIDPEEILKMLR